MWELEGNETFCMVGNHAISVIAEAMLKGIGDFDHELAFEAMKASSLYDRDGMGLYDKLGYIPADKIEQSVAKSLEIAVDDWAVGAVAEKLGKSEDAAYFFNRSENYRSYFDKETGFMRGKLAQMADGQLLLIPFIQNMKAAIILKAMHGSIYGLFLMMSMD
jgi:putative alpha-1,2-mannosidase